MRCGLALLLTLLGVTAAAGAAPATYRWVDEHGVVNYSDRPPYPRAATQPSRAAIDELLALSGLKRQTPAMTARVLTEFHQQRGRLVAEDRRRAEGIAARHLRAEVVYARIVERVGTRADGARLEAALAWFRSSAGRAVTEREVAFSESGDVEEQIARYAGRFQQHPPRRERVALVERLDAAGRASETSLDVSLAVIRGLATALAPHLPAERRIDSGQLEKRLEAARQGALEVVRRLSLLAMLFVYRDVSDGDLAAYVQFAESPAGQWYVDAISGAYVETVGALVNDAAVELLQAVPPQRWLPAEETRL